MDRGGHDIAGVPCLGTLLLSSLSTLVACGGTSTDSDVATPSSRLRAIADAAQTDDPDKIRMFVEQLDSDDPAVRLAAITALERSTGQTLGYRHDDPRVRRDEAVRRWVTWVSEGGASADG
jgi:hypothetical protein